MGDAVEELRGVALWVWDSQTQPGQVEESSELGRQTAGPNGNHMGGLAACLSRLDERKVGERELPQGLESELPICRVCPHSWQCGLGGLAESPCVPLPQ